MKLHSDRYSFSNVRSSRLNLFTRLAEHPWIFAPFSRQAKSKSEQNHPKFNQISKLASSPQGAPGDPPYPLSQLITNIRVPHPSRIFAKGGNVNCPHSRLLNRAKRDPLRSRARPQQEPKSRTRVTKTLPLFYPRQSHLQNPFPHPNP
jgi:hypothetical protein